MQSEELEKFQHMWNVLKMTSTEIAKSVGRTRNSVSGMISRAREAGWHFETKAKPQPQAIVTAAIAAAAATVTAAKAEKYQPKKKKPLAEPKAAEITIVELQPHHCKAVIGSSSISKLPVYCGLAKLEGRPYCEMHQRLYSPGT